MKNFELNFSNRVIEHLGIKLYQNKPTNVIAEFLSNCWDADATSVHIDLKGTTGSGPCIVISDNGLGMTRDEIIEKFLVIGRNRRKDPSDKSAGGRPLMGRKGIGKLAGFGIAGVVDVISCPNAYIRNKFDPGSSTKREVCWLRFNLADLVESEATGSYTPDVLADSLDPNKLQELLAEQGFESVCAELHKEIVAGNGGVCVVLSETVLKRVIDPGTLLSSMGRRFTVTLLRDDFVVQINGQKITSDQALPPLQDFRIGSWDKPHIEVIPINGIERQIRFWVGFVDLADSDWSIENAGVGVYAHGKIAQDRPFFFDVKGKEILSRYMYAVVEADWLDELPADVVSTDRRSIDWGTDYTEPFHTWGSGKLSEWLQAYKKWREQRPREEIKERIRRQNARLTPQEEDTLAELLSEVFTDLGNNEEAKETTTHRITAAWTHEPTRKLTQSLWKKVFSSGNSTPETLTALLGELNQSLVPEAMGLAVTMAQRVAAITSMTRIIENGQTETHLQRLIELFPWLIDPKNEFLTANQTIRTLIEKKHKPDPDRGQWLLSEAKTRLKPDFVFLADPSIINEIVVYELKGPEHDKTLQLDEYEQLSDYLGILQRVYNNDGMKIRGVLIGHDKGGFQENDNRITVKRWSEVLLEARMMHVTYLTALLKVAEPSADDLRLRQIANFGGAETVALLGKYASNIDLPPELLSSLEITGASNQPTSE